jgi:DNA-binding CsgD family transcriptional regulator
MKAETDRAAQFSTAVALIYESIIDDAQRGAVEMALCALLDADELAFTCQQTGSRPPFAAYGSGMADVSNNENAAIPPSPAGRPAPHVLSLDIASRGYDKLRLIVVRNPGRTAFTDRDLTWLSLLQPHLQNAEFVKRLFPEGVLGSAASGHFVRSMSEGLVIVSADGAIEWLNPSARKILAARQGLSNRNGRLHATRAFETARIKTLIRGAACGHRGAMLVGHAAMWLPYGLAFTPLETDAMPPGAGADLYRSVLITIKDMRHHIDVIIARLTDVFGFTKAEQRIGALLLAGHNLGDAADLMGKSLSTVKKQLRSMLTKTGARSQAELLSMFLSVPSLI